MTGGRFEVETCADHDLVRWRGCWSDRGVSVEVEPGLGFLLGAFLPCSNDVSSISLRVRVWHSGPKPFAFANPAWDVEQYWSAGQAISVQLGANGRVLFDPDSRTVNWHSSDLSRASVWVEDPARVPFWVRAAPALRVLDLWSVSQGMLACHAAAFTVGAEAVLLIGAGCSGKSTLSVQAASMGFGFIGDDYTLLEPGTRPVAHALYRSAKLRRSRNRDQITSKSWPTAADSAGDKKQVLFIHSDALIASAPIGAVVAPHVADLESPRIERISAAEAVRTAAPSTLQQLPGDEARKLRTLARAFTGLPCFRLHLARDDRKNVLAIARTMHALRPRPAYA